MAGLEGGGVATDEYEYFDMTALWRLAVWGGGAGCALIIAAFAAYSDSGSHRLSMAFAGAAAPADSVAAPITAQLVQRATETENEARRLGEAVRTLNADRERLIARLETIERNLTDVTGAISHDARVQSSATAAALDAIAAPAPIPWPAVSGAMQTANRMVTSSTPLRDAAPAELTGPKREFAVDIGGSTTMSGLRALWESSKSRNPALFENLRPVAAVRDGAQPGTVELRLVVGPLAEVGAAVRLCAALGPTGLICQPAIFDGQRLAAR